MAKKYIVVLLSILMTGVISAQDSSNTKYRFRSINSVVLVNGNNAVSAALQTVNGFQNGAWFAGVGLGLDYYLYRTVPVFADVRYEFGKKKNKFFLYGDLGMHFDWVPGYLYENPSIWNGNRRSEYTNGLYTDGGVGLVSGMKKGNGFVLSLGFSKKTLQEKISYLDWRTSKMQTDVNTYRLNRIMLKLGFQF